MKQKLLLNCKLVIFLAVIINLIFSAIFMRCFATNIVRADNTEIIYAYLPKNVMLYDKVDTNDDNAFIEKTLLPQTYFVAILGEISEKDAYIHVSYLDISGYVKKSEIEITDYEPVNKYASAYLKTFIDGSALNLRSSPTHLGDNIIANIESDLSLLYYGTRQGSAQHPQVGNVWYYVAYEDENKSILYGYIYSLYVIPGKIESNIIAKVEKPAPKDPNINSSSANLESWQTAIFIVCLSIPAVLTMFFLFSKAPEKKRKPRSF